LRSHKIRLNEGQEPRFLILNGSLRGSAKEESEASPQGWNNHQHGSAAVA
jgi:hypothetical protein